MQNTFRNEDEEKIFPNQQTGGKKRSIGGGGGFEEKKISKSIVFIWSEHDGGNVEQRTLAKVASKAL